MEKLASKVGVVLLLLAAAVPLIAAGVPAGFSLIFNGIEPGKKFHPLWPPVVGQNLLGVIVEAKNPKEPQAYFESIDSPNYRNPNFTGQLEISQIDYQSPSDLSQDRKIGVDIAFSQLDAIANAIKGKTGASQPVKNSADAQSTPSSTGASGSSTPKTSGAGAPSGAAAPTSGTDPCASAPTSSTTNIPANTTGIDFSHVYCASVKSTGIHVRFYTLAALQNLAPNKALTLASYGMLTDDTEKMWIVHRILLVDNLQYTLHSNTNVDVGLFAKLTQWLPTFSVKYANGSTVVLSSSAPVTIGYKLWRPGTSVSGASIEDVQLDQIGIGDDDITKMLGGHNN